MAAEASEVSAQAQAPQQQSAPAVSVHDRLKAFLSQGERNPEPEAASNAEGEQPEADEGSLSPDKQVPKADKAKDQAPAGDDEVSDDAQSEERQFSNLTELLEAGGFDSDKGYDLAVPVKIDGKEGTATIRDLLKSYQLDGHINQRLATLDTDRKAFQAEQQKFQGERADKLLRLDAGLKTLERAMLGEFQSVDWNKLAAEDPASYNSQFVSFQQRNAYLQDIGRQIEQERTVQQQKQQEEAAERLESEKKLMLAKVPEWANETQRQKDKAEMTAYMESQGITKEEFEAIDDHRFALVARDAWKWAQLQKGKPAVLKKVTTAPKLLKPGTQQSKDASNQFIANKERERLRQTGKISDAVPALKRLLFR